MQEQGKRLLLTVGLALGVMLVFQMFTKKDEPPPATSASGSQVAPKPATPGVGVSAGAPVTPNIPAPVAVAPVEAAPRPPEQVFTLPFDNVIATFSSYCGGLTGWQLTDKRYEH